MHGLIDNLEFRVVGAPVANASSTDNNSTRIDMADYESVAFLTVITDSTATGVAGLKIEENDADSDSGMAEIAGSSLTATCVENDDINQLALITEVFKPAKRFVQAVRTSATANIAFGSVIAVLKPRRRPAVQGATIKASAYVAN
ncbi:hypothetical protein [Shinella pollutisoli]|uniref:Uncharacterized protein n=1 Tax=Shinella pollutisoli TaxID=2250594 RepID=A0ABV7DAH3_9HYPH|nr:hypothetical protein [Shinella pollutisoli]